MKGRNKFKPHLHNKFLVSFRASNEHFWHFLHAPIAQKRILSGWQEQGNFVLNGQAMYRLNNFEQKINWDTWAS